jgi:hypothetical protein
MWRLQLKDGRAVPLRELPATLGRDDAASVRLRHPSIAPLHARLREGADGSLVIEAVGEALLLANGRAQRVAVLVDGESLVLGQLAFTVHRDAPPPAAAPVAVDQGELTLRPRAPAGASSRAATAPEPRLRRRGKTLQFKRVEARPGLLHADLSQLPAGRRALLVLGLLAVAAALAAGIGALIGLLG